MNDADVIIIGSGLTGLSAAFHCRAAGLKTIVLEKESTPGGRIKTTVADGYILDHGFQVILSSYVELTRLIPLHILDVKPFWSGARVRINDDFADLLNPLRHPSRALFHLKTTSAWIPRYAVGSHIVTKIPVAGTQEYVASDDAVSKGSRLLQDQYR